MRQDIKDTIARLRWERDRFKALSTARRKEATQARRERRWLDVIRLMDRVHEYAHIADGRQAEIVRLKKAYTI